MRAWWRYSDYFTYFKPLPSQLVEFAFQSHSPVITVRCCLQHAIFPVLCCGGLACALRGDFGRKRVGYSPWRHGSETLAIYNRAESEPRHEDYERREEIMFTHVVSLFFGSFFWKGLTVNMFSTSLEFQEFDFPRCPRANGEDARAKTFKSRGAKMALALHGETIVHIFYFFIFLILAAFVAALIWELRRKRRP